MEKSKEIRFEAREHKGQSVIFIKYEYDKELNEKIKKLIGVKWSQSQRAWYVQDNANYRTKFGLQPKPLLGKATLLQIHPINQAEMKKYIETLQLKGYSPNTINTYRNEFAQLLHIIKDKNIVSLDANRLRNYFLYCTNELKLSENTLHSRINAIKFYFEKVLARDKLLLKSQDQRKKLYYPMY